MADGEPGPDGEKAPSFDKTEAKNVLSANVLTSLVGKVWYLFTRLFLPPVILRFVTLEEYGLWATCFILIGYIGMSAFGVSNVYIRYVAEYRARGEVDRISRLLSTGIWLLTGFGAAVLVLLWLLMPGILSLFHVAPALRETARILFLGTAAIFLLDLSWGAYANVLTGLQKGAQQNAVWMTAFTLEAVLIPLFLLYGAGVKGLLWAFVLRSLVTMIAHWALCRRALPGLRLSLALFDRRELTLFWRYGAVVQVSGLLSMFLWSLEKLLAGVFLGVSATAVLDVGEKLPQTAIQIPSGVTGSFLPAATSLHAQGRSDELRALFLKGSRYLALLAGLLMGFLAPFALPLMKAWMGDKEIVPQAALILALFTVPYQMHVTTGTASALFKGTGRPKYELVYPLLQLALIGVFLPTGFALWGRTLLVICGAVAAGMSLSGLVYAGWAARVLGVPLAEFARKVLLPGFAPYAVGALLAAATRPLWPGLLVSRPSALALILPCGLVYVAASAALFLFVLCDWGEREFLIRQTQHTFGKLLGRRLPAGSGA